MQTQSASHIAPESEEHNKTIVTVGGLGDDQIVAVAEAAERRIAAINKIKSLALRVTNASDWCDMGGKPYLEVSGAEKVARLFGISWQLHEPIREEHEDGHFTYIFKGTFSMGVAEIEALGTRSSKDKWFSEAHGNSIPPSEIDRNDVRKSAMTNAIGNGITRLLGIRNLTWEEVKTGGIDQTKTSKVDYKEKAPGPGVGLTIPYGKEHKGKRLDDESVPPDFLVWLATTLDEAIKDPKKKTYKEKNEALWTAIDMELKRRESPPTGTDPEPDYEAGESIGSHKPRQADGLNSEGRSLATKLQAAAPSPPASEDAPAPSTPAPAAPSVPSAAQPPSGGGGALIADSQWLDLCDNWEERENGAWKQAKAKLRVEKAQALVGADRMHFRNTIEDILKQAAKKK